MQAVTVFKAQQVIGQLQSLGFPDWQCVPAILKHGCNLEAAITYLLEGTLQTEAQARALMQGATVLPHLDISHELAMMQQAKARNCSLP